ncbi:PglZ domain-containing protein [Clostridium celatum]|uniref:PglZ domain-containing protein n=1 Tax=Clostridium celatum TaxID=36834 RepID=UPI0018976848|nr:PglZ domain-containing protein [Clostridium celatum]
MFDEYLEDRLALKYEKYIMVLDEDDILSRYNIIEKIKENKFNVEQYNDVEKFRYLFETKIKKNTEKYFVIVNSDIYIPYDIRNFFYQVNISFQNLFPKINPYVVKQRKNIDFDLLSIAYNNLWGEINTELKTNLFLENTIYSKENISEYLVRITKKVNEVLSEDINYLKWSNIALIMAKLSYVCTRANVENNSELKEKVNKKFKDFIFKDYKMLSGLSSFKYPVLLNKSLDYMFMNDKKIALIVMDCMSLEDWLIISESFNGIEYKMNQIYALIPTITAISRQSLLAGKLPLELKNPFSLGLEKKQFIEKGKEAGYKESEIKYYRGYDINTERNDKLISIIINDIDDLVHNELQGKYGLYSGILHISKENKLVNLVKKLYKEGFSVYITSDHGHSISTAIGKQKGTGVEVETRCKRAIIYKGFVDKENVIRDYNLVDYPGFYMPKEYNYLICNQNEAFGIRGEEIISHGGMTIEEVIVPFIKIKGVNL